MKKRDRYLKIVEWSDEDGCYVGSVPGFLGPCCHGAREDAVYRQLCEILDEWIEVHEKDGIPLPEATANKEYSGKFILRLGKDLHKLLAIKAVQANESINHFCQRIIRKAVRSRRPT
jgi:predicted HicB family RNase H-like nuclease